MDYLPDRDSDLVTWSAAFSAGLTALTTAVGISSGQASDYADLNDTWVEKFNASQNESTNSMASRIEKNEARAALVASARQLAGIVQKFPGTTNAQRAQLGLTVKDVEPAPAPIPGQAAVEVLSVNGRTAKIRIADPENPTRRGKPDAVASIVVFSYVGETAPLDLDQYAYQGTVTRTITLVQFGPEVAFGAKVWFVAVYLNRRGEEGAPSVPVSAILAGGTVEAA
jgi:hypothetical protein